MSSEIKTYSELLKFGQSLLDKDDLLDESSVEEHLSNDTESLKQMKDLNKYVYTVYSTNEGDKTYSIEFFILASAVDEVLKKLKEKDYWYIAKNYSTNEIFENIGSNNKDTEEQRIQIPLSEVSRYNIDRDVWSWHIESQDSKQNTTILRRQAPIYFLSPSQVDFLREEYTEGNYETITYEGHTFEDLLPQLAVVTVEDPIIGRKTLYTEVYDIIKNIKITGGSKPLKRVFTFNGKKYKVNQKTNGYCVQENGQYLCTREIKILIKELKSK